MTSGSQALPTAKPQGFRWFSGGDAAMGHLCSEALRGYLSKPQRGVKVGDKVDREIATKKLLYCLAAVGPKGPAVAISLKVEPTELPRYPRGHRKALEALVSDSWVECVTVANKTGSTQNYLASEGKMSAPTKKPMIATAGTYRLSAKAWTLLIGKGFDIASLVPDDGYLIVVKTGDDERAIELGAVHPEYEKWLGQVKAYNALIRRFLFTLDGELYPVTSMYLKRVFNSADCLQGGRFYSEFSRLGGDARARLQLDGLPLVSMDYKALHPRLAFAVAGLDCPEGDLYQLEGHEREHVKEVITAAVATPNPSGYSWSVDMKIKPDGGDARAILDDFKAKHCGADDALGNAWGLMLQRADSLAAEVFLDAFMGQGRPLLPVHDGYYFLQQDRALFQSLMPRAEAVMYQFLMEIHPNTKAQPLGMKYEESPLINSP
jgi:hypothetical protein